MSTHTREMEALCRRLEGLRHEIAADSAALRARWHQGASPRRWLLGALGAGGLLFSLRGGMRAARRFGIKPLLVATVVKFLVRKFSR